MDLWISKWISRFQSGFVDFKVDFWISKRISGFQSEFLDFKQISGFQADFWISKRISEFHLNHYYSEDTAKIGPCTFRPFYFLNYSVQYKQDSVAGFRVFAY